MHGIRVAVGNAFACPLPSLNQCRARTIVSKQVDGLERAGKPCPDYCNMVRQLESSSSSISRRSV
jgi:hypothetical protein